jgi:hypothetical protein
MVSMMGILSGATPLIVDVRQPGGRPPALARDHRRPRLRRRTRNQRACRTLDAHSKTGASGREPTTPPHEPAEPVGCENSIMLLTWEFTGRLATPQWVLPRLGECVLRLVQRMEFAAELENATRPRTRRCRTAGQGRGRVLTAHTLLWLRSDIEKWARGRVRVKRGRPSKR